jgi:hypothetical protein
MEKPLATVTQTPPTMHIANVMLSHEALGMPTAASRSPGVFLKPPFVVQSFFWLQQARLPWGAFPTQMYIHKLL